MRYLSTKAAMPWLASQSATSEPSFTIERWTYAPPGHTTTPQPFAICFSGKYTVRVGTSACVSPLANGARSGHRFSASLKYGSGFVVGFDVGCVWAALLTVHSSRNTRSIPLVGLIFDCESSKCRCCRQRACTCSCLYLMAVYDSPLNLCAPNTQLGLGKWAIAKKG